MGQKKGLTIEHKEKIKELTESRFSPSEIAQYFKDEYGIEITPTNVCYWKRKLNIGNPLSRFIKVEEEFLENLIGTFDEMAILAGDNRVKRDQMANKVRDIGAKAIDQIAEYLQNRGE